MDVKIMPLYFLGLAICGWVTRPLSRRIIFEPTV